MAFYLSTPPIPKMLAVCWYQEALSLGCLFRVLVRVRLHDLVEIRLVDHSASLGTLGLLLEVLAEKVQIEFAVLDLGASLQTIPGTR